ncbi:MAG: hypothetical protein ACFCVK_25375 [Acidimicrobiales bacterium]
MNRKNTSGHPLTDTDIADIARDFEEHEFTDHELARIKPTRRRTPTIGEATAVVVAFRAPPAYKERIKRRAENDHTTESQVIRDALDAYLADAE